ncbi:hypothetical protein DFH07DRAFT_777315 [Mycena maculata]|uniref:Uncharacterized protein n=1 Tax=Mycena maculata TaxID=230809 RepID=A0AAD7IJJ7_9AGAR|nr:hypothetical protein DFH07DRAFT_777315 [Mycena maculata]
MTQGAAEPVIFDRACIITVQNTLPSANLERTSFNDISGKWRRTPGSRIIPGGSDTFELTDTAGSPFGAEGTVSYKIGGSGEAFTIHFQCPLFGDNIFTSRGRVDFNRDGSPLFGTNNQISRTFSHFRGQCRASAQRFSGESRPTDSGKPPVGSVATPSVIYHQIRPLPFYAPTPLHPYPLSRPFSYSIPRDRFPSFISKIYSTNLGLPTHFKNPQTGSLPLLQWSGVFHLESRLVTQIIGRKFVYNVKVRTLLSLYESERADDQDTSDQDPPRSHAVEWEMPIAGYNRPTFHD